ncbi:MAG: DUF1722 domain-containing protein [Ketobacteraceae bacterium]|nr:DUF1722 domain-containing protein [Ketobacteraceae bacterium]
MNTTNTSGQLTRRDQSEQPGGTAKIPVGISECLLGSSVRYNGGHKHSRLCTQELGDIFDFKATCPELAAGLGVPREPVRLVDTSKGIRVRGSDDPSLDVTESLVNHGQDFIASHQQLCGFIFTQKSPSCGLYSVKVYHQNGNPLDKGRGAFAASITERAPHLPVEEAGRLNDPLLKETFVSAVFVYHDWLQTVSRTADKKSLIDFHSRHKFQLMAHCNKTYRALGKLIADLGHVDLADVKQQYLNQFMTAIKKPATRGRHCHVMEHIQGYLRNSLSPAERQSINRSIHDYRKGFVPLVVPMTMLTHYAGLHHGEGSYLRQQSYLAPYPLEMGLRNDI